MGKLSLTSTMHLIPWTVVGLGWLASAFDNTSSKQTGLGPRTDASGFLSVAYFVNWVC